jgi:hypothetical protein
VEVRVEPLASRVVLTPRDPASLARGLRAVSRSLCPQVAMDGHEVVLTCRSRFLAASLVPHAGGRSLEVRELQVPPWSGRDGGPVVPLDPVRLTIGPPCPGGEPVAAAECALATGQAHRAEELFREAIGGPDAALAALRLGDLAARAGDLPGAIRRWKEVSPASPLARLSAARLCETDPRCIQSRRASYLFAPGDAPPALRADLLLRSARLEAFHGKALEAAQSLAGEQRPDGACAAEPVLCRDVLLAALREPGARGAQALALYLETPSRDRGHLAPELAAAAAERAADSGAPVFAANLLSAVSGAVPPGRLSAHLARAAELYLHGGDRTRAGVVLEFARSRLPRAELASARWARLARVAGTRPQKTGPGGRPELAGAEEDLRAAERALAGGRGDAPAEGKP